MQIAFKSSNKLPFFPSLLLTLLSFCGYPTAARGEMLAPSEKESVLLRASGSMWGATEDAFSTHTFSLKSDRGNAIWSDKRPDWIVVVNPENKTYLGMTIPEYMAENNYGVHYPLKFDSAQAKNVKLKDGSAASEVSCLRHQQVASSSEQTNMSGLSREVARITYRRDVKLSPSMLKAWATIVLANPEYGVPVMLKVRPGRHREEASPKIWRNLFTYYSMQKIPFDASRFTVPKDFKPARDKSALYLSQDGVLKKSDIDDLFRGELK